VDLSCQIEALKLEMRGDGHQRKGNSLFGEVDDKRMEIERKMISLKVRYETLEKTYATTHHQLRKMKVHLYMYMLHTCMSCAYMHITYVHNSSGLAKYRQISTFVFIAAELY
jgi:hypothetical protein